MEIFSQIVILIYDKQTYSFFLKPFVNQLSKYSMNYQISWDYEKNKMKPGTYITTNEVTYSINSKGFRGNEFNLDKDKIRIIAFGGSTTLGLESPDNLTYPYQLEKILNQKKNDYEVINMGFGSKSLNFIKNLFFKEAFMYDPDFIIIYSNRNSIFYDGSLVEPIKKINFFMKINHYFQENIMTYRVMFKMYKRILFHKSNSEYLKSPYSQIGISKDYLNYGYINSLKEIIDFSESLNIDVILVKQAYFFENDISSELEKYSIEEIIQLYEENYFLKKYSLSDEENFWSVLGFIINKKVDELRDQQNVLIVDPVNILTKNKENFVDYLHLTPRGNYILASEVSKIINNIK